MLPFDYLFTSHFFLYLPTNNDNIRNLKTCRLSIGCGKYVSPAVRLASKVAEAKVAG